MHESAFGPKQTSLVALHMSAFGGKADIRRPAQPLALSLQVGRSSRYDARFTNASALSIAFNPDLLHRASPDVELVLEQRRHLLRGRALQFERNLVERFAHVLASGDHLHRGGDAIDDFLGKPRRAE